MRTALPRCAGLLWLLSFAVAADFHDGAAQAKVESLACGPITVGARLNEEARIHSRRDLGWRTFPGEGHVDVERAFRVSKSMEIRYRWRVDPAGKAEAQTGPAQELCK